MIAYTPQILKEKRLELGWSCHRAGTLVGCSFAHFWNIEEGRKMPSPDLAARIEEAFAREEYEWWGDAMFWEPEGEAGEGVVVVVGEENLL